jgi:hypothetical protein
MSQLTQQSTTVVEPQRRSSKAGRKWPQPLLLKNKRQLKPKKRRPPKLGLLTSPTYLDPDCDYCLVKLVSEDLSQVVHVAR